MVEPDVYTWQWSLISPDTLKWRAFGESAVLFDARNGDTHFVDSIVPFLLQALSAKTSKSLEVICDELDVIFENGVHPNDRLALILSSLQQLEEMNFVRVF